MLYKILCILLLFINVNGNLNHEKNIVSDYIWGASSDEKPVDPLSKEAQKKAEANNRLRCESSFISNWGKILKEYEKFSSIKGRKPLKETVCPLIELNTNKGFLYFIDHLSSLYDEQTKNVQDELKKQEVFCSLLVNERNDIVYLSNILSLKNFGGLYGLIEKKQLVRIIFKNGLRMLSGENKLDIEKQLRFLNLFELRVLLAELRIACERIQYKGLKKRVEKVCANVDVPALPKEMVRLDDNKPILSSKQVQSKSDVNNELLKKTRLRKEHLDKTATYSSFLETQNQVQLQQWHKEQAEQNEEQLITFMSSLALSILKQQQDEIKENNNMVPSFLETEEDIKDKDKEKFVMFLTGIYAYKGLNFLKKTLLGMNYTEILEKVYDRFLAVPQEENEKLQTLCSSSLIQIWQGLVQGTNDEAGFDLQKNICPLIKRATNKPLNAFIEHLNKNLDKLISSNSDKKVDKEELFCNLLVEDQHQDLAYMDSLLTISQFGGLLGLIDKQGFLQLVTGSDWSLEKLSADDIRNRFLFLSVFKVRSALQQLDAACNAKRIQKFEDEVLAKCPKAMEGYHRHSHHKTDTQKSSSFVQIKGNPTTITTTLAENKKTKDGDIIQTVKTETKHIMDRPKPFVTMPLTWTVPCKNKKQPKNPKCFF